MSRPVADAASARLRQARIRAGYLNAADFARAVGISPGTYWHHETGHRKLKPHVAHLYAKALGIPAGSLLYGERLQTPPTVPVVGRILDSGTVTPVDHKSTLTVVVPDPSLLVAMLIIGNDLYPAYRDGDVIYHHPLQAGRFHLADLHGLECIVELSDGRQLLRQITDQGDGRATLVAYAGAPIFNATVVSAAPVAFVQRHINPRLSNSRSHSLEDVISQQ